MANCRGRVVVTTGCGPVALLANCCNRPPNHCCRKNLSQSLGSPTVFRTPQTRSPAGSSPPSARNS
eukprot:8163601-Lingulodinium_polyedra.AAC.1